MAVEINTFRGQGLAQFLTQVGQMRMTHYRNYPYLYQGSVEHEDEYISDFPNNPNSILVGAFEHGKLEGFVLGTPMDADSPILAAIPNDVHKGASKYYIADVILNINLRSQGISEGLMKEMEREIICLEYRHICLLTVFRPESHPKRPHGYMESRALWERFGYVKQPLRLNYDWPSLDLYGNVTKQTHEMNLWSKTIK